MTKNYEKITEFKRNIGFNRKLKLDDRDNTILTLVQQNPSVSQEEIARKVKLSQPAVGARLKKLKEKGILHNVNGVNFKVVDLYLAKVDVNSTNPGVIIKAFENCPFFVNALITSGKHNLCLFFTATDLPRLEGIVNYHLRGHTQVKDVEMNIVISTTKDFVLPLNINDEKHLSCKQDCKNCV